MVVCGKNLGSGSNCSGNVGAVSWLGFAPSMMNSILTSIFRSNSTFLFALAGLDCNVEKTYKQGQF